MNPALGKALVALVPTCLLLSGAALLFFRERTASSLLQFLGAGSLAVAVLTHGSEALDLLPWMDWGSEYSIGHYLDFISAGLGRTLFPIGYLVRAVGSNGHK